MESVGLWHDQNFDDIDHTSEDWEALLETADPSKDMSFAQVNAKRKQLTFKAFSDPKVPMRILILENMVSPSLQLMDKLFKRSGWISSLYHLPNSERTRRDELKERRGCQQLGIQFLLNLFWPIRRTLCSAKSLHWGPKCSDEGVFSVSPLQEFSRAVTCLLGSL